jgi:hypothetical protein
MRNASRLNEILWKSVAWLKREVFKPVLTCPAAWCFATIWAVSAIYIVAIGGGYLVLLSFFLLAILMFFCVITVGMTKTEHKPKVKLSSTRQFLLLLQVVVIVFFICITFYTSLMFHSVVEYRTIPVWSSIIGMFSRLGEKVFSNEIVINPALAMANPAQYFLLPLSLLLLLGARFTELGFSRGHRTLSVIFLWCFIPVGVLAYLVVFGRFIYQRTRNLLACSVIHIVANSIGR